MEWICGSLATLLVVCLFDMVWQRSRNAKLRWQQVQQWHQFLATRRRWLADARLDVSEVIETVPDDLEDWRDQEYPRPFRGPPA